MGSGHVHPAPLKSSWLGRLDARAKILAVIPAVFTVNLLPWREWAAVTGVACVFLALILICGPGAARVLKRGLWLLPFAVFVAATLPFTAAGEPVFSVHLGVARLVATDEGIRQAGSVLLRGGASILGVLMLSGTTEAPDLFRGLKALYVPGAFVAVISMVYRYLFEIGDEFSRLRRAAAARGFVMADVRALPRMGTMAGALMARSIERSQRVHRAMLARGFDGDVRTISHSHFATAEWLFLGTFYAVTAAAITLGIYA